MNIDRARELLHVQTSLGSGYNRNSARLIRELDLEQAFGFKPGTVFKGA